MEIYTYKQWEKDGSLKVQIGQQIEKKIYFQLLECMPPTCNGKIFQCGEAYSHDWKTGRALYMTFECKDGEYYYVGLKPAIL